MKEYKKKLMLIAMSFSLKCIEKIPGSISFFNFFVCSFT